MPRNTFSDLTFTVEATAKAAIPSGGVIVAICESMMMMSVANGSNPAAVRSGKTIGKVMTAIDKNSSTHLLNTAGTTSV